MTTVSFPRGVAEWQGFWQALEGPLAEIEESAEQRDQAAVPRFPADAFALLRDAGVLGFNAHPGDRRPPANLELSLVRRIAAADGSVGRIFDGHLNAVERLAVQAPAELRDAELREVCEGRLLAGVWGGNPGEGDGSPAEIAIHAGEEVIRGVKAFCSGAGGLDRAVLLVRDPSAEEPVLVWVDLRHDGVEIDRTWYRAAGLVASESHRVVFHDVPVMARLGAPGAVAAQPWFARDALRTTASWAGMADTAVRGALTGLAQRSRRTDLDALAAGRVITAQRTIGAWMSAAATAIDGADPELPAIAIYARAAVSDACRSLLEEAAGACGSGPFVRGEALDRARRDLGLFLLQHRLDPLLVRVGSAALDGRS